MVSVDDAIIASIKRDGHSFEVLVDCEKAMELRRGGDVDMSDVLAVEEVFKDARKGEKAADLEKFFGTEDPREISRSIIRKGEIQLTTKYRRKLTEEKKRQVISKMARYAMDPQTKNPIPEKRIELGLEQIKYNFDPFKSTEEQVREVIESLRPVLPISMESQRIKIIFPPKYAPRAYGTVSRYGKIIRDMWLNNGSWLCEIEIPAGMREKLFSEVNSLTQGSADIRIIGDENE